MPKTRSTKPESVKQAVVSKRLQGDSKRQIAKDLEINRSTVDNILDESNVEASLAQWRRDYLALAPSALNVVKRVLGNAAEEGPVEKDQLSAALQVLKGTGIHTEQTRSQTSVKISNDLTELTDDELKKSIAGFLTPKPSRNA